MALTNIDRLKFLAVLLGATVVAFKTQFVADSGSIVYSNLFIKILIAIFSYGIAFFVLYKKKVRNLLLYFISLAVLGTIINTVCVTIFEGYSDYWFNADSVANSTGLLQDYLKLSVLRLLILVPINSLIFLIVAVPVYLLMQLINKQTNNY
jgi:hypothetical protein